jgi:hypothetical protein
VDKLRARLRRWACLRCRTPGFHSSPRPLPRSSATTSYIVVNAAAYAAVDRAESEPDLARTINAETPGRIAGNSRALAAC